MSNEEQQAVDFFKHWAQTYDDDVSREVQRFAAISHDEMLARLVQRVAIEQGSSVLDVGTGTGWSAIRCALQHNDVKVIGVDRTPDMLSRAVVNAERLKVQDRVGFTLASAMHLPYGDDEFDVVVSVLTMHHTIVSRSLQEIFRVLKPGGRMAIADMGAPAGWRSPPLSWIMQMLRRAYGLVGGAQGQADAAAFEQTYTADEWRRLLAANGLKQAQVTQVGRSSRRFYPCVIFATGTL